jgi:hypothetical protein
MTLSTLLLWLLIVWLTLSALRDGYKAWTDRMNNPTRLAAQNLSQFIVYYGLGALAFAMFSYNVARVYETDSHDREVLYVDAGYGQITRESTVVISTWRDDKWARSVRKVVALPGDPLKTEWGSFTWKGQDARDSRQPLRFVPSGYVGVATPGIPEGEDASVELVPVERIRGSVLFTLPIFSWSAEMRSP